MDIEELKKEFCDVDWMRAIFNEYTVQSIEWMVDRIIELTEENEALFRDKEFLRKELNKHLTQELTGQDIKTNCGGDPEKCNFVNFYK